VDTLTGREFIFYLGQVKYTEPANYRVQGFAASLMNLACESLDAQLEWDAGEAMLAQVHDAAFLEGDYPERLKGYLQKAMTRTIEHNGLTMHFPIDLKVGTSWGHMEAVNA